LKFTRKVPGPLNYREIDVLPSPLLVAFDNKMRPHGSANHIHEKGAGMTNLSKALVASVGIFLLAGNIASAAGLSPAQCNKLEREYKKLQDKEKRHQLTPAERKRMHEIDDQTNLYCM